VFTGAGISILSGCSSNVAGTNPVPIGQAQWSITAGASASEEALQALRFYPQNISIDGPSLSDTAVTIAAGQTVTWTNESNNEPHTVTIAPVGATFPTLNPFGPASGGNIYDGTTLVNSGVLAPGQSFSLQFTKPGTYTYHCIFHDDTEHMIGTVIVQ
jgi:plastocyanin